MSCEILVYKRLLEVVNKLDRNEVSMVSPCTICLVSNEWSKSTKEKRINHYCLNYIILYLYQAILALQ